MGISSINNAYGASYGAYNQKLTKQTKELLDENGIIYNSNITEAQAQKLLKAHESQKASQENAFQGNSGDSLHKRAVELAKKLGISPDGLTFEQILAKIKQVLEEKIKANPNNLQALQELKSLNEELSFIEAQSKGSSGFENSNQALMQSLELLSEYNKNFLHR